MSFVAVLANWRLMMKNFAYVVCFAVVSSSFMSGCGTETASSGTSMVEIRVPKTTSSATTPTVTIDSGPGKTEITSINSPRNASDANAGKQVTNEQEEVRIPNNSGTNGISIETQDGTIEDFPEATNPAAVAVKKQQTSSSNERNPMILNVSTPSTVSPSGGNCTYEQVQAAIASGGICINGKISGGQTGVTSNSIYSPDYCRPTGNPFVDGPKGMTGVCPNLSRL